MMMPQLVAEMACTWVLVDICRAQPKGASLFRATANYCAEPSRL